MSEYIANKIAEAKRKDGVLAGQKRYRNYFIRTSMYQFYKADVDVILTADGHEDCIVTE